MTARTSRLESSEDNRREMLSDGVSRERSREADTRSARLAKNMEPPSRIEGLDLARCLAIFGMVFVNFKIVMGATAGNEIGQLVSRTLEGRAAALFVVLAGVGITLMTRSATTPDRVAAVRGRLIRRAAALFVIGLAYAPIWPADILHFYGLYILAASFLFTSSDRALLGFSVGALVTGAAMVLLLDFEAGWRDFESLDYLDFWTWRGMIRHMFFNGFHPFFPWVGFLLFGMWLGRQRLDQGIVCWKFAGLSAVVALLTEIESAFLIRFVMSLDVLATDDIIAVFGTTPLPAMPHYMVAGAATSTFVICICVLIGRRWPQGRGLKPLVHTGQMALTLYFLHVIVGMGTLASLGLIGEPGHTGGRPLESAVIATLSFCALSVFCCHLWRLRLAHGPLEWIIRFVSTEVHTRTCTPVSRGSS